MGISIKNDEVEALVRRLAGATGETVTDAIGRAVRERLELMEAAKASHAAIKRKRLTALIAEFRKLPVYDDRDHGDMLYDKDGLPK